MAPTGYVQTPARVASNGDVYFMDTLESGVTIWQTHVE